MKRKTGDELESFKLELVDSLLEKFTSYDRSCAPKDLYRYDYFFEKFDDLKNKGNYTENDIELIFRKNMDMISFILRDEDLFNGDYSSDEIKYVLGKSYKYNIDFILKEDVKPFTINNLVSLLPYKDILNDYYDGLSELVSLLSKVELTSLMMDEIKSKGPVNFYTISKCLTNKLITILNNREEKNKFELQKDRNEKEELLKEKSYREQIEKDYSLYGSIREFEHFSKPIKEEYIKNEEAIVINNKKLKTLLDKYDNLEQQLNTLVMERKRKLEASYDNEKSTLMINNVTKELEMLSSHPILNIGKISRRKQDIKKLTEKAKEEEKIFEERKKKKINDIDSSICDVKKKIGLTKEKIEEVKTKQKSLNKEKQTIIQKIDDYFKCDSIEKIDGMIEKSKMLHKTYDVSNHYILSQINQKLDSIDQRLLANEKEAVQIAEEKRNIQVI